MTPRAEFKVDSSSAGARLDIWLAKTTNRSRSGVQRVIKEGLVQINGKSAKANRPLEAGDIVVETMAPAQPSKPTAANLDLPMLYEDRDLIVIDKPAGLSVHPGAGTPADELTVVDFARHHTTDDDPDRPGIVHRLDKDTSGLLVIAKSRAAKDYLQRIWKDRAVAKTYRLLTIGRVEPPSAVLDLPVGRDTAYPLRRAVTPGGKPARTRYTTVADYPGFSLIEADLKTGRTHQLRVHFAAIGHPIAGDILYGRPTRPLGLKRQFLHAYRIEFVSPSGHKISITSDLPPDLKSALAKLDSQI